MNDTKKSDQNVSNLTPIHRYNQLIKTGQYQFDEQQYSAVCVLQRIHQDFIYQYYAHKSSTIYTRFWGRLTRRFRSNKQPTLIKGAYLWGEVGRGKTFLMDLFYHCLPNQRKLRLHFHRFMLQVHESLTALQGHENPLQRVADQFKSQADILCFDEFFVNDITDAMLLGNLIDELFKRGITLVATSNIPPDGLYRNGLQRARFLPAIDLIKQYCEVFHLDAGIDYRFRELMAANLFITPISPTTSQQMQTLFRKFSQSVGEGQQTIRVNHRSLVVINRANQVLAADFTVLCCEARSAIDYIELANHYHTLLLHNVKPMNHKQEDIARRFIALVDELYERKVKLVISSEVPMSNLYQGKQLQFEFQRCLSRLQEMQSVEYLQLTHLS